MMETVLVTGGTGFVGSHIVALLLKNGFKVRTIIRSPDKEPIVRSMLANAGIAHAEALTFHITDLLNDTGWAEACTGCDYVMHVASPLIATKDEDAVVRPAVAGTRRVLTAARNAAVKRVVFTSTCGTVYYGHPKQDRPFDESNWSNLDGDDVSLYVKSKILAERAAWDFMQTEGGKLELTVINPSGIFGPILGPDYSSSIEIIARLLQGRMPACPDLWFGVVDVLDVADLHLRAMLSPEAKGQRYIATSGNAVSLLEIAKVLKKSLRADTSKVPVRKLPNIVVRVMAIFNSEMQMLLPLLGNARNASSEKAITTLNWSPRSWQDAVLSTATSLIQLGQLKVN